MTLLALLVELAVLTLVLLLVGLAWLPALLERRHERTRLRRRVVVSLVDGKALDGLLWRRERRVVVLRGARLLEPGSEPQAVDGEVVVEVSRIDFMQVVS